MKPKRSKRIYYCVVMPTLGKHISMGAVFGCSTDNKVARKHLDRAHRRGARGLDIDTTFFPPKGYNKWLPPAH